MKKQKAMEIEREDLRKAKNLPTGMIQDSNHWKEKYTFLLIYLSFFILL